MTNFEPLEEPEKKSIGKLLEMADDGDLGIPDFQRDFTWDRNDIADLFESIFRGYYIGSVLFWANSNNADLESQPIRGVQRGTNFRPRYLVLDGQQRISSLYYATKVVGSPLWNYKNSYFYYLNVKKLLDLIEQKDEHNDEKEESLILSMDEKTSKRQELHKRDVQFAEMRFPLIELQNYHEWIYDYRQFLVRKKGKSEGEAKEIFDKLRNHFDFVWDKFQVPIIKLSEKMDLENVAKVFEKLNSTGVELTIFDLLNARMLKHGISLRTDLWKQTKADFEEIQLFSEKNERFPTYILQTIALMRRTKDVEGLHVSAKGKDLLKLSPENFREDWYSASRFVEEALKRLRTLRGDGFGVLIPKFMPYFTMIPPMAALLNEANAQNNKGAAIAKIKKWYWSSLVLHRYSSSTDTVMTADFREMINWFDNDDLAPKFVKDALTKLETLDYSEITKLSDALYKGILCLIALQGGRDFVKNDTADFNSLDDHHIFPESKASQYGVTNDGIQTILNKTLLDRDTNRIYIRDKDPSVYLSRIKGDQENLTEQDLVERMATHLISQKATNAMLRDNFNDFIAERASVLKELLIKLLT